MTNEERKEEAGARGCLILAGILAFGAGGWIVFGVGWGLMTIGFLLIAAVIWMQHAEA